MVSALHNQNGSTLENQPDTILVTGGAGFIGSNFILQWLDSESSTVINLDKLTYAGNPANLASVAVRSPIQVRARGYLRPGVCR